MDIARIIGPWQYRRFIRFSERFCRCLRLLWLAGLLGFAAVVFTADTGTMQRRLATVFALTFVPGISSWFILNGLALIWKAMLWMRHLKNPRLTLAVLAGIGFAFVALP